MLGRLPAVKPALPQSRFAPRARQAGVVLMIALIVLVALAIGGIALVRSVGTTSVISGNLAFQQAATREGEVGTETAIRSIEVGNPLALSDAQLENDNLARGYVASAPAAGNPSNWAAYWAATIDPAPITIPVTAGTAACGQGGGRACTLVTDPATSNTVSYTIQRLCQTAGDPLLVPTACASHAPVASQSGGSLSSGNQQINGIPQHYYRITARVVGPRNTVSYVQTIVRR